MRERKVTDATIERYMFFLNSVSAISGYESRKTIAEFAKEKRINKSVVPAIIQLNFVETISRNKWNWLLPKPNKEMVLQILDLLLHKKKKTIHIPIVPEWATMVTAVNQLTDRMGVYLTQNEKSLRGTKTPLLDRALQQSEMNGNTIFSEHHEKEQRRFEMVKAIAGDVLKHSLPYLINPGDTANIENTADMIIEFADAILLKFNKPTMPIIKNTSLSPSCYVCGLFITPHPDTDCVVADLNSGNFYCIDHAPESSILKNKE